MFNESHLARGWFYPVRVWLTLLALVFAAEYAVMLILPLLLSKKASRGLESAVDAVVLTLLVAPALWWTIVRPLSEIIRLRTKFLSDLFESMERDRRQTAHDLHDGVGQALTLLISGLRSAKPCGPNSECALRVNSYQQMAEAALGEVRRLALGLRPSLLDDLGLVPALERLVDDVGAHHPLAITLETSGLDGVRLPDDVATAVFRIVQEALSNVMQHARARQATITVRAAHGHVALEVNDDGCGMEAGTLRKFPAGHLGLRGMRERAVLLGGTLSLQSSPGHGTRLRVSIPLRGAADG
jgi:signal transduction histidine kinase